VCAYYGEAMTALIYAIKDLSFDGKLQSRPPTKAALSPKEEDRSFAQCCANVISLGDDYCVKGGAYTIHTRHMPFCIDKMQHVVGISLMVKICIILI
jgi:hypothetical protein